MLIFDFVKNKKQHSYFSRNKVAWVLPLFLFVNVTADVMHTLEQRHKEKCEPRQPHVEQGQVRMQALYSQRRIEL